MKIEAVAPSPITERDIIKRWESDISKNKDKIRRLIRQNSFLNAKLQGLKS